MIDAGESIRATVAALEKDRPFAIFLRHSEREPIPAHDPYADVRLTPRGVERARDLGTQVSALISWTVSSPFLRCRSTAQEICPARAVEDDPRLGRHGPWVIDNERGAPLFARLGTRDVVRAQIAGASFEGLRGLAEGTQLLLSTALEKLDSGRGAGICVSHDAVLMPAIAWMTGDSMADAWLEPLDGFAIQRSSKGLTCIWRGRAHAREGGP